MPGHAAAAAAAAFIRHIKPASYIARPWGAPVGCRSPSRVPTPPALALPPLNCPGGRTTRAHAAGSHVVRADLATRDTGRLHDGADNSAVRHMGGTHSSDAIQNVDEAGWHPTAMEPAKRTPRRSRPRVLAESLFSAVDRKRPDATSVPLMRACDVPSPTTR